MDLLQMGPECTVETGSECTIHGGGNNGIEWEQLHNERCKKNESAPTVDT